MILIVVPTNRFVFKYSECLADGNSDNNRFFTSTKMEMSIDRNHRSSRFGM
jgi:hypothetical protein